MVVVRVSQLFTKSKLGKSETCSKVVKNDHFVPFLILFVAINKLAQNCAFQEKNYKNFKTRKRIGENLSNRFINVRSFLSYRFRFLNLPSVYPFAGQGPLYKLHHAISPELQSSVRPSPCLLFCNLATNLWVYL